MPIFPQIEKAGKWDTLIQQGSTFTKSIEFENFDFDISDFSFRGYIKRKHTDKVFVSAYTFSIISNNEIEIYMSSYDTAKLIPGIMFHDIEIYYEENGTDLFVARILEGKVRITPEVTKPNV